MVLRIGIDTGGTFTDLVGYDDETRSFIYAKRPSTPDEPALALGSVLDDAAVNTQPVASIVIGTTVATNAVLQRRGARVCFVTTAGFEDVPLIGRLDKEELYNLHWQKPDPLVARRDCFGVAERIGPEGSVLQPMTAETLNELKSFVARLLAGDRHIAIALCFLFSYLAPEHEQRAAAALRDAFPGLAISVSHEIAPTWREYERGSTTIGDAYIKPVVSDYIRGVQTTLAYLGIAPPVSMLKSNGGHLRIETAAAQPAQFLLSGLAGGIVAARHYAQLAGAKQAFSLDMGGTSADIGTIQAGRVRYLSEFNIGFGLPVAVPCVDVATLGAGGGSIAWIDKGDLLQVGPQSAGADPGPVCYDAGGAEVTVTDADLVLGRLNPDYFLGGKVRLNRARAEEQITALGDRLGLDRFASAQAIVDIADEHMANRIRLISVDRGLDPREFALVAFGGAGPLHGTAVARLLGIHTILVPPHPGLCSAFGALAAHWRVDRVWTVFGRSTHLDVDAIRDRLHSLVADALHELGADGFSGDPVILRSIDMRYAGQNYEREVSIPPGPFTAEMAQEMIRRFARAHDEFYGFSLEGEPVEFVNLRVTAIGATDLNLVTAPVPGERDIRPITHRPVVFRGEQFAACPIYRRTDLASDFTAYGPLVIEEEDSTTIVHPGDMVRTRADGLLEIQLNGEQPSRLNGSGL